MNGWDESGRCGCDQFGRCLADCPTAHLPFKETPLGRQFNAEMERGRKRGLLAARAVRTPITPIPSAKETM